MPELKDLEKIIVVTGHFGAGKTNFAVNLAKEAKKNGRPVTLIDLDIVNPYFRAADDKGELEELGIRCIIPDFANTNVDIPTLPPEIYSALEAYENPDYDGVTIFDVGGDNGAAALGMYEKWFREYPYSMLYCCSLYRPLTEEPEDAVGCMREIEYYSRLRTQGIVNTSNLGEETTAELIRESIPWAERISELSGLPVIATVADKRFEAELSDIPGLFTIENATKALY